MIIYEAIHAELAKYVSEFQSGVDSNNRAQLFYLYKLYNEEKGGNVDHIYMTMNYISPMASALRQFDNNRYPIDYYKDYAWDGLRGDYNYTGTLTDLERDYYNSLRPITNTNIEVCN